MSPRLSVATLAAHLGISRTALYRNGLMRNFLGGASWDAMAVLVNEMRRSAPGSGIQSNRRIAVGSVGKKGVSR